MKRVRFRTLLFVCGSIAVGITAIACNLIAGGETPSYAPDAMSDAQIWAHIEAELANGVNIDTERPAPSVLSEKETLIKAAKVADKEGFLDPSSPLYEEIPDLATAKVEEPILLSYFNDPNNIGVYGAYLLTFVDENGECVLDTGIRTDQSLPESEFHGSIGMGNKNNAYLREHYISEREAKALIESQFPGQEYEGPTAGYFDLPYPGNGTIMWYFTVGGTENRSAGAYGEYLIDAEVHNYGAVIAAGGMSNRSIIDSSPSARAWGNRMAKLAEPQYFFNTIREVKAGRPSLQRSIGSTPLQAIPVPLR